MNTPENYSDYERTGNKALDLVAQAIGWAKTYKKPIVSVTLNRTYYAMFWAGVEILMQKPLPNDHALDFEGIPVKQGSPMQWESLTIQLSTPEPGKLISLS